MSKLMLFAVTGLLVLGFVVSCKKDAERVLKNCDDLTNALQQNDTTTIAARVNQVLKTAAAQLSASNTAGVLQQLVTELNHCSSVHASLICVECIDTLPPISEIKLEHRVGGVTRVIIFDIIKRETGEWRFTNMHE